MKEIKIIYINKNSFNEYCCDDYEIKDGWIFLKNVKEKVYERGYLGFNKVEDEIAIRQRQVFKMHIKEF